MDRDHRIANASKAIVKLADEMTAGGVKPKAVAHEILFGLVGFMAGHAKRSQTAALLREHLAPLERADRSAMAPGEREMLELSDKAIQFIRTLELAGVDESTAVTVLQNACTMRIARTRGVAGAVTWLRRIADQAERNATAYEVAAQVG